MLTMLACFWWLCCHHWSLFQKDCNVLEDNYWTMDQHMKSCCTHTVIPLPNIAPFSSGKYC